MSGLVSWFGGNREGQLRSTFSEVPGPFLGSGAGHDAI